VYWEIFREGRDNFSGKCLGSLSGVGVRIPVQDYKSVRVDVMIVLPWLTDTHTQLLTFDFLSSAS